MANPPWKTFLVSTALLGAPGCFFTSCVARGARVRTPGGSRPIEDLREGDEVLSFDPLTGRAVPGAITMTRSARRETVLVRCGEDELVATSDHPVYCPTEQVYAPAGDWALGRRDRLWRLGEGGPIAAAVTFTAIDAGVREVFDLTVDTPFHNFCAEGFLVHNKSPALPTCDYEGRRVSRGQICECPDSPSSGSIVCPEEDAEATCDCPPAIDASTVDASTVDASTNDASTVDASTNDASTNDASTNDAGPTDGSVTDAGATDGGAADAGSALDAG